jgi:ABC-type enterochelin transport system permease subunit
MPVCFIIDGHVPFCGLIVGFITPAIKHDKYRHAGAIITIIGPFIQWIHDNLVLPAKMGRKVAL